MFLDEKICCSFDSITDKKYSGCKFSINIPVEMISVVTDEKCHDCKFSVDILVEIISVVIGEKCLDCEYVTNEVRYDLLIYCLLSDIILYFLLVAATSLRDGFQVYLS